jgi:hypothetical protein
MRCYFLRDGHIKAVEELKATSDVEAILEALILLRTNQQSPGSFTAVEVWDHARVVYRHADHIDRPGEHTNHQT